MTEALFLQSEFNFLELPPEACDPATAGAVVLPMPYERSSTFGLGSANGPEAILKASHEVELFDAVLADEPHRLAGGIATREPLSVAAMEPWKAADLLHDEAAHWLEQEKFVCVLGGEHASIVGAIRACSERYPDLTVLQLDAHSDLREEYEGDPWSHACAMARVLDFHKRIVQAGIRSQARAERERSEAMGFPVFYAHGIHEKDGAWGDWAGEIVSACSDHVYLTIDADAFDPSVIPATGTPEPGGFSWSQMDVLLEALCRSRRVVGMDVSELSPIEGVLHPQFTIAKLLARLIGRRFLSSA
jgi:agmatinase